MFREPSDKIFSSTQLDSFLSTQPGTSNNLHSKENSKCSFQEFQILQKNCQEKEGEVTILRTQLNETKSSFVHEQNKLQSEWKKKLVVSEKQIQSIKSELEFKVCE